MTNPWILALLGTLSCVFGVWRFYKTSFEDNESLYWPVAFMIGGVCLIAVGTAKYFHLI